LRTVKNLSITKGVFMKKPSRTRYAISAIIAVRSFNGGLLFHAAAAVAVAAVAAMMTKQDSCTANTAKLS
jgi:hypothetical protein